MAKKPSSDETRERRLIIKKLMLERGITNRNEIHRILELEHGIKVTRQTIYTDIKKVASVSEADLKEFELDILGIYKKNIRDLQCMIDSESDNRIKSSLMRTLSSLIKDQHEMALKISKRNTPSNSGHGESYTGGEDVVINFGKVEIDDDKD